MCNILLVDDEPVMVHAEKSIIKENSPQIKNIYCAYNIKEACRAFKQNDIDIMFSDIDISGENGIDLLKWVNENYPFTVSVFITANDSFTTAHRALKLGVFDYVLKPISKKELLSTVVKSIERRKYLLERKDYIVGYRNGENLYC